MSVRAIGPVTAAALGCVIIERRFQAWVLRLARYFVAKVGLTAANSKFDGRRSSVSRAGRSLRKAASGLGATKPGSDQRIDVGFQRGMEFAHVVGGWAN